MDTSESDPGASLMFLGVMDERWQAFAGSKPEACIFHHPSWLSLLAQCYGYHPFVAVVCDEAGSIRSGLPMMEVKRPLTGRRWVSLPFTDYCAPLYDDTESLSRLVDGLIRLCEKGTAPQIELRSEFATHPTILSHTRHVLHTVDLDPDADSVASHFHHMHRRNIRAAGQRGVNIVWGEKREHLHTFYRLHLETRRRQGIPVQPWRFFDLLGSTLIEKGLGFVLLAYFEEQCLAAAVFLHWQKTLTYKFGASSVAGLRLRPNNLLFWTAIRWACENGYTLFDMGRTDVSSTSLRAFKDRWGAREAPLAYSTLPAPSTGSDNAGLIHIAQAVIRNSPVWVCRAAGELLYRYFG